MKLAALDGVVLHKPGGKIKALARGNGLIEGYLISFGGPGDGDLEGQWFTPNTDIRETFFKDYPVLFHHGMDKDVGLDPIGRITSLNKDSVGWYVQAFLDLHDPYGKEVFGLVQTEPFGWSSGSVDHLVVILQSGEIVVWPLYEGSVTPSPMQPNKTTVRALKSLGVKFPRLEELEISNTGLRAKAAWAGIGNGSSKSFSGESIMTMLKARPSTLATVAGVLKAAGFKANARQIRSIAAQCDMEDAATMAGDDFDDATMGFGGADDQLGDNDAMQGFGDPDDQDATMDFPYNEGGATMGEDDEDFAGMAFGDDDDDPSAMMAFGDDDDATLDYDVDDNPPMTQSARRSRKGNEGGSISLTPVEKAMVMKARAQMKGQRTQKGGAMTSAQLVQQNYINRLERKIKAMELEEAPGERQVGMSTKALRNARITDAADRPGAYKAAFVDYLTRAPEQRHQATNYILQKGAVHDENPADTIKGLDGYNLRRVKALNTSNAGSVGFAVPDDFVDELNRNIMVEAKTAAECKTRTTTSDTILIPDLVPTDARRAYTGRVTWTGETASGQSESDVTPIALGQINLPIHVMLVSTVSSLSAMEDAAFDLQAYITEAFSEMIAIEYDELIMSGNGQGKLLGVLSDTRVTGAASTGVSSVSGYIASGSSASISDADKLRTMLMQMPPQYRNRAKWFMNSNTADVISRLKDGVGRYLWGDDQGLNTGIPVNFINRPVVYNEYMPDVAANAFPLVYADMSRAYTIGKRVEFSVRRFDDSAYATQDQCLILGRARLGGQPTLPVAIKVLKIATS